MCNKNYDSKLKRVELNMHTNMSKFEGVVSSKSVIRRVKELGMTAVAITDNNTVQAFPEIHTALKNENSEIKVIHGIRTNIVEEEFEEKTYSIICLKTKRFDEDSIKIMEIGIIKYKNGQVIDKFETLINMQEEIPEIVKNTTKITNETMEFTETIDKVIPKVLEFIKDTVLVAHDVKECISLIGEQVNEYVDIYEMALELLPNSSGYRIEELAENLGLKSDNGYRALDNAKMTLEIFEVLLAKKEDGKNHITILAKNNIGLTNLYKVVSEIGKNNRWRITKRVLDKYREGLIIGSELYLAISEGTSDKELEAIISFYDYLEIQPTKNKEINKKIVALGEKFEKVVVATGNSYYLNKEDKIYKEILESVQGIKKCETLQDFKTTEEMLEEFSYLGKEKAYEVVVTNTNKIANKCDTIEGILQERSLPYIENAEKEIREISYKKAYELYGNELPKNVKDRLEKELNTIISNGFSVIYIAAQKLVSKSNEEGYIVGTRGLIASSLVAYLLGITEVNPLIPHYKCKCSYSNFSEEVENKTCPKCGSQLKKEGAEIPFETLAGLNGEIEPDINLNFASEYKTKAYKYSSEIFGKDKVYKAGRTKIILEKEAYEYANKYYKENEIEITKEEIIKISKGLVGVKKADSKEHYGIMIIPKEKEVFDFTPMQLDNSNILATHFDYHDLNESLLKLNILGHDDPSIIKMLQDLTGVDLSQINLDDKETMSIFSGIKTLGIPGFGSKFVREMLEIIRPTTFDELIKILSLSHGTDTWIDNAKNLLEGNIATIDEIISSRDDIILYLTKKGISIEIAYEIMELVRRGRALKNQEKWKEYVAIMKEKNVPNWYIESCEKIKYLFPKAHSAAYTINAFRIAWFKVHYPLAYYAAMFTVKGADDFDMDVVLGGKEIVEKMMKQEENKNQYAILELVMEMYERGFEFSPCDREKSEHLEFKIEEGKIRIPIKCMENKIAKGYKFWKSFIK